MAQTPSEKVLLGATMAREFLGEDLLSQLGKNTVSHLHSVTLNVEMLLNICQRDDIFTKTSQEYITEVCFSSYARPGLKFRERSLMNIAMLTALKRGPELRLHITAAIHNGLTEEEICEACRQTMIYCGVPAGRDALAVASDVLASVKNKSKV